MRTYTGLARLQRRPVRVTTTMPAALHEQLLHRSDLEGRSLSNLIAYLLEVALEPFRKRPTTARRPQPWPHTPTTGDCCAGCLFRFAIHHHTVTETEPWPTASATAG
jgi:hypothetical protein